MKHHYFDKYSSLDTWVHRINSRIKLLAAIGFILLFIFVPLRYIILPALVLLGLIYKSKVPFRHYITQAFVLIPFLLLAVISNKWDILPRGILSVLTAILLSSTTSFTDILSALGYFRCPKIFLMIMAFMYRYFFVLTDELMRLKRAKDSRTIRQNRWADFKYLSQIVGVLFIRSYEKAEKIYIAMCARGYTGEIK